MLLGIPALKYDYTVAFEDYGRTSFLWIVTAAQVLFGPSPYGMRLADAAVFLAGALLLFRLARRAYGAAPAVIGLTLILFLPTWIFWSVSLLKEALYFALSALALASVAAMLSPDERRNGTRSQHAARWIGKRLALLAVVIAVAWLLRDLRTGAVFLLASGLGLGVMLYVLTASAHRFLVGAVAAAAAIGFAISRPPVQDRIMAGLNDAAREHIGHVAVVVLRPQCAAVPRIDQSQVHPQAFPGLARAALQRVADAQPLHQLRQLGALRKLYLLEQVVPLLSDKLPGGQIAPDLRMREVWRAVGAESDRATASRKPRHVRHAGGELAVGSRAVRHAHPAPGEDVALGVVQPDAVRENQALVGEADVIEVGDVAHAARLLHEGDLVLVLGRVRVHIDGCPYDVDGRLLLPAEAGPGPPVPAPDFHQSFLDQLRNVIDGVRGRTALLVPAAEALPSLATIERCYQARRRMAMPWLGADERAGAEAPVPGA